MLHTRIISLIAVCLLLFSAFRDTPKEYYDPTPYCKTPSSGDCPTEGEGHNGAAAKNAYLNSLKNRDIAPASTKYIHTDLEQILEDMPHKIGTGSERENWQDEWKKKAAKYEKNAVRVYGYIDKIEYESEEECNCYSETEKDYHIWLGSRKDGNKKNLYRHDMVVELSPRLKKDQKSWDKKVAKIVTTRDSVRVSGWVMFDNEHYQNLLPIKTKYTAADYKYKTRITLWEVHPIHAIEVYKNGKWKPVGEVY